LKRLFAIFFSIKFCHCGFVIRLWFFFSQPLITIIYDILSNIIQKPIQRQAKLSAFFHLTFTKNKKKSRGRQKTTKFHQNYLKTVKKKKREKNNIGVGGINIFFLGKNKKIPPKQPQNGKKKKRRTNNIRFCVYNFSLFEKRLSSSTIIIQPLGLLSVVFMQKFSVLLS